MCPEIKRVACVGSGLVGQGWAALFALNGYEVVLEDLNDRLLKDALTRIKNQMVFLIDAGLAKEKDDQLESIETTTDVKSAVKNADYVQESIFESYDAKKALYSKMDEFTSSDVILASSTSGLMMTHVATVLAMNVSGIEDANPLFSTNFQGPCKLGHQIVCLLRLKHRAIGNKVVLHIHHDHRCRGGINAFEAIGHDRTPRMVWLPEKESLSCRQAIHVSRGDLGGESQLGHSALLTVVAPRKTWRE